jgi:hypothetical protein
VQRSSISTYIGLGLSTVVSLASSLLYIANANHKSFFIIGFTSGMSTDCQKLRWTLNDDVQAQLSSLLTDAIARDRRLTPAQRAAEARRMNLIGEMLKENGVDPTTFGIPLPEKLSSDVPPDGPA